AAAANSLKGCQIDFAAFLQQQLVLAGADMGDIAAAAPQAFQGIRIVPDKTAPSATIIADIGLAQRLLKQPGGISRLIVANNQPAHQRTLAQSAPGLRLEAPDAFVEAGRLTDSFHLNLTAFGLLSFAVGLFIVQGAIRLVFEERRQMVRTLRTLGLSLRQVMLILAAELLCIALIAGAFGIALGYFIAAALMPDVAATLAGLYGQNAPGSLQLRPNWLLSGLGIALLGTALAGAASLLQIMRVPLLQTAHSGALMAAARKRRLYLHGAALVLFIIAGLARTFGDGLISGFVMLGCILIGAALLLPGLLDALLAALADAIKQRAAFAAWFIADTRFQLPGLSLALMALLLAMATNIGVSTMVQSFRQTFVEFLDQRLAAEFYVDTQTPAKASALKTAAAQSGITLLPILSQATQLLGRPVIVQGLRVGPTYTQNWQFLTSENAPWDSIAAGQGVSINEQMARRLSLTIGDLLALDQATSLRIVATHSDYGNPKNQLILSEQIFKGIFPELKATRFGLRTPDPDAAQHMLRETLAFAPSQITDQRAIKDFSLAIFDRTFTVTSALNVLTLGVAAFAILMSLLTAANMRISQVAPLWALGVTRRTLAQGEIIRALGLAGLTAICAVPLGLVLAWMLLAVVNVEAFGWRLPMFIFPGSYVTLALLALAAAGLAALWPAWRLSRTAPRQLLQVFASER
ncbi:MAG: FtsX-like permease family protein, partial [Pseudomonadota bacterium]